MGGGVFCVFTVTFDQFHVCLLNKSISFIHDILVALHSCIYLSVRVCLSTAVGRNFIVMKQWLWNRRKKVFGLTLTCALKKKFVFHIRKCESGGSYTSFNIHRVPGEVVNGSKCLGFQFLNDLSWPIYTYPSWVTWLQALRRFVMCKQNTYITFSYNSCVSLIWAKVMHLP